MLVKVIGDRTLGANSPEEFSANLDSILQENKQLKAMAETAPDLSAVEKRISDLEATVKNLDSAIKILPTESRVGEIVTSWAGSTEGKKTIGAEASRITMEAMAATGTTPVKPAPAGSGDAPKTEAKTFPQIVQALTANGMIKTKAIETAVANNPKEYAAWCDAGCGAL